MLLEDAAIAGEQAKEDKYCPGYGYLPEVDVKIGKGVEITPFKNIAQQETRQQHGGRGIGPENGQIGNEQNPCRQKGMVAA